MKRRTFSIEFKRSDRHAFHQSRRTYGAPRVFRQAAQRKTHRLRDTVAKFMRDDGLRAEEKRAFVPAPPSQHGFPVTTNTLDRNFKANAPDTKWVTDITYIKAYPLPR